MSDHESSSLHEKPLEFLTGIADSGGYCDGQSILVEGDHYRCSCTCGRWAVEAPSQEEGLHLARLHTGSISS